MSAISRGTPKNSSATIAASSASILTANPTRQYLFIQNTSVANSAAFTLDGTAAVINSAGSIQLSAGSFVQFDTFVPNGPVNAIGSAGSTTLTVYSLE